MRFASIDCGTLRVIRHLKDLRVTASVIFWSRGTDESFLNTRGKDVLSLEKNVLQA